MTDPMADFAERLRNMSAMKIPAMPDMDKLVGAYQRNVEAFAAANKVAMDSAQAVARRNMEIMQQSITDMGETVTTLSSIEAPQAKAARQAELLKQSYEKALSNLKEVGDMIQHANQEALSVINQRVMTALDEVKSLADHTASSPPG